jgi:hypothetical protein
VLFLFQWLCPRCPRSPRMRSLVGADSRDSCARSRTLYHCSSGFTMRAYVQLHAITSSILSALVDWLNHVATGLQSP